MTVQCGFGPRSATRRSPLHTRNSLFTLKEVVVEAHELDRRRHTLESTIAGLDRLTRKED